jgi:methylated-DNA-[protein]-cysteine S-methyltransferase
MRSIVKSDAVHAELTRYSVAGWGEGELWTGADVVLAHDFRFSGSEAEGGDVENGANGFSKDLVARLRAFLAGDEVVFADVRLDLASSTPFQRAVVGALRAVPAGEIVSYGELAAVAGYPGAQRAVGTICARNRFMFLVPCHRVVAADGIGRYGSAGVAVKRRLLALEGVVL